ncbi:MAG: hypothetical protein ABSG49_02515 [Methanoregula sp.]|jgi:hypothetical protein|uniref:hypothetical protein n=1 Tax=Methanoregula sp. TaxID=2052170 RepID=UPI003C26412E
MQWYPLTVKEALLLLVVFVISGIFSNLQQYFVEPSLRPYTYVFALLLLLLAFFPAAKPADPLALAKFLAVLLGAIFALMIVLKDLILQQNLSWNIAIVLAGAVLSPLVAGGLYSITVKKPAGG